MTLKEIAAIAGVSPSAVSRYLNGGSLSAEKGDRIRRAIEETGYRPNVAAQTLRTGHLNQIGVIVPRINSFSVSEVLSGVNEALAAKNYMTMLGCTNLEDALELQYLDVMQANHAAGILLMGTSITPAKLSAFRACGVPLVITGQNVPGFPCVHHDDYNAMKELTNLIIRRGRKHILYLGVNERDAATGSARRRGAQDALREAGIDPAEMTCIQTEFDLESGYRAASELLREHPETDAMICATDKIAHGAILALREAGKRLPEEVSVVGVGNDWADTLIDPPLTTAQLYHQECGRDAAGILLQMIEEQDVEAPVRQIRLSYTLVERGSV